MAVWFVAIASIMFYFAAIPVKFAFVLQFSHPISFGAGISAFNGRYALHSAQLRALGLKKHLPWKKAGIDLEKLALFSAALQTSKQIFAHLHLDFLHADGRISSSNAANTALICGYARALEGMLLPHFRSNAIRLHLEPDFSATGSNAILYGMVSIHLGHIIGAALAGAWNYRIRSKTHGKTSH